MSGNTYKPTFRRKSFTKSSSQSLLPYHSSGSLQSEGLQDNIIEPRDLVLPFKAYNLRKNEIILRIFKTEIRVHLPNNSGVGWSFPFSKILYGLTLKFPASIVETSTTKWERRCKNLERTYFSCFLKTYREKQRASLNVPSPKC